MVKTKSEKLEHPLIRFELPQDLFKTDKIRLKFTKKLSLLLSFPA